MKTLNLTPAEVATLGGLLWTLRFTMARMAGQHELVRKLREEETVRAVPEGLREALVKTYGDIDDDIPLTAPASMDPEFTKQVRTVDSILEKLCNERAGDNWRGHENHPMAADPEKCKYFDLAQVVRQRAQADGAIVIVLKGDDSRIAPDLPPEMLARLPEILWSCAQQSVPFLHDLERA